MVQRETGSTRRDAALPKSKRAAETPAEPPAGEPEILQRLDAPAKWAWAWVAGGMVLAAGLSVFAVRGAIRKGTRGG